jgi:adenylate cyclase
VSFDQYRLTVVFERNERRGPVFERLRKDVDALAALEGMQHVFKLRAADIYRVLDIEHTPTAASLRSGPATDASGEAAPADTAHLAELSRRLSRCADLDAVISTLVRALADLFGYEHTLLMLLDESGTGLYTIASHGYDAEGVGSELALGDGMIGWVAERCTPVRSGALWQMEKYSRRLRRSFEDRGELAPGPAIPVPGLADAKSRIAVPAMARGELVGVVVAESREMIAFTATDEAVLTVIAGLLANAVEIERSRDRSDDVVAEPAPPPAVGAPPVSATKVRFFPTDGSLFLDGDYLIKGVAGRILWSLLRHYLNDARVEFTNREIRLDPSLELPPFRDNLESRLILLKRRLEERQAPIHIEKTGRGRVRLDVHTALLHEAAGA